VIILHQLAFLNDNFIVAAFFYVSSERTPFKTDLMKNKKDETQKRPRLLHFSTSLPTSSQQIDRPNTKVFVLSLLCYRLKGQMVFTATTNVF
jgi:hypothetical protein